MADSQYSFSLTTFSPTGKLVQIEYALMAVAAGQTSLGIRAANGVVLATEKKLPTTLVDETSETIPLSQLVRETATVMQEYTQSGGVRPFGVSLLVAGYDDNCPQLYQIDPSGSYFPWKATAIGKNVSNAKTFLEKRYTEEMELEDAIHTAILTLKEGFEGQVCGKNIEVGIVGPDCKFRIQQTVEWGERGPSIISCNRNCSLKEDKNVAQAILDWNPEAFVSWMEYTSTVVQSKTLLSLCQVLLLLDCWPCLLAGTLCQEPL